MDTKKINETLNRLIAYLYKNIDDITEKQKKKNISLDHDTCLKIYENWCSSENKSLTVTEWKYCIQTLENILTAGMEKSTLKLLLEQMLSQGR